MTTTTSKKLLSIITVVYNSPDLLEKTIKSVLLQDFTDYEYLVVDGNSTDGTMNVIKRYEDQLTKYISEPDTGIYHAMNKGVFMASGKWVCMLNAGDAFVGKDILGEIARDIENATNADVVYGDMYLNRGDGLKLKVALEPENRHRMYFCHQSAFVRKECLDLFKFDEIYHLAGDFKFFKECFLNGCNFLR